MKITKLVKVFNSVQPGEVVDLWIPVSGSERQQNLEDAEAWLRLALENAGAAVGRVTHYVGPRYAGSLPIELRHAARRAKRKGRKLIAETLDRFIRVPMERHDQSITRADLQHLRSHTLKADLVTWLDPNATSKQIRAHRTMRGQWAKANKGGGQKRYLPRADEDDLAICEALLIYGHSLGDIAKRFGRSRATIQSWAKRINGAV